MRTLLKGIVGVAVFGAIAGGMITHKNPVAVAQERKKEDANTALSESMKRKAVALTAMIKNRKPPLESEIGLLERNLLDWKDKTRGVSAGSLWIWGKTGRPAALLALFYYQDTRARDGGVSRLWNYEMTPLTSNLASVKHDSWVWTPDDPKVEFRPVPDAPAPGQNAEGRQRQIQLLAHQFAAVEEDSKAKRFFLPLYPDMLHRYEDAAQGIVDGALFVFVHETNPEVLMLLECQKDAEGRSGWHVAFAPVTAAAVAVYHVDEQVYTRPLHKTSTTTTPYTTQRVAEQLPGEK